MLRVLGGTLLLATTLSACGRNCPGFIGSAFQITVVDADTQVDICNAVVTASAQNETFALNELSGVADASCTYSDIAGTLSAGAYTLDVSAPGYATFSAVAFVERDDCDQIETTMRTVALSR